MVPGAPIWRATATFSFAAKSSLLIDARATSLFRFAAAGNAEHDLRDAPHLDFLGAFGDAIAPMMPENMLEGLVARIADRSVHLHRAVGRVAHQPIRAVVAHRDLIGKTPRHFLLRHLIHLPRG